VLAAHAAISKSHQLTLKTDQSHLIGRWDVRRVRRVIENVVSNAIKYSPDGGPVVVSVCRRENQRGHCAVVRVRDAGVGIAAADLPHVLEMGWRGSNGHYAPGTGVGLAGAQRMVLHERRA
jgi:signal transduction histidine kinase